TLTLSQPGSPGVVVDKVRYQSAAPWPRGSNGVATAASIEVIDPRQDNSRPGNWLTTYKPAVFSAGTNLPVTVYPPVVHPPVTNNAGWHFVSLTATNVDSNPSTNLLLYLDVPGNLYIDDLSLVDGPSAGVGFNFAQQGDFEVASLDTNFWQFGTNYANSSLSS